MSDELKPCPFCQSTDLRIDAYNIQPDNFHSAFVECGNCEATGPNALTVDGWLSSKDEALAEAVAAWNRAPVASAPTLTDAEIVDQIDRPGFAWENMTAAEQSNLLNSIKAIIARAQAGGEG